MLYVHTKVNDMDVVLFSKPHISNSEISMLEILKIHFKKRTEKHFQDAPQKLMQDNNSEYIAAYFVKHFTQKPSPW